jgi:hypothetical protein
VRVLRKNRSLELKISILHALFLQRFTAAGASTEKYSARLLRQTAKLNRFLWLRRKAHGARGLAIVDFTQFISEHCQSGG